MSRTVFAPWLRNGASQRFRGHVLFLSSPRGASNGAYPRFGGGAVSEIRTVTLAFRSARKRKKYGRTRLAASRATPLAANRYLFSNERKKIANFFAEADFAAPWTRRRDPEGPGRPADRETRVRTPASPSFGSAGRATAEIRSDTFGKIAASHLARAEPSREPTLRPRGPRTDVFAAAAVAPIESRASRLRGFARSRSGKAPFRNRATAKVVLGAFFRAPPRFLFSCGRTTPPTVSGALTFSIRRKTARSRKNPRVRRRSGFEARTRRRACFPRPSARKNRGDAPSRPEFEAANRVSISLPVLPQKIPKLDDPHPTYASSNTFEPARAMFSHGFYFLAAERRVGRLRAS